MQRWLRQRAPRASCPSRSVSARPLMCAKEEERMNEIDGEPDREGEGRSALESEGERKSGLHAAYAPKFICATIKPLSPFSSLTASPFEKKKKKKRERMPAPLHGNIATQWAAYGKWPTIPLRYFALRACTLISRVSSISPTLRHAHNIARINKSFPFFYFFFFIFRVANARSKE